MLIRHIFFAVVIACCFTGVYDNFAQAQTSEEERVDSESAVPSSEPAAASSINQQTGVVQFNNSEFGSLNYPNCGGVCAFAIGRLAPGGSGRWEAIAGVVWQFRSPENTQAQASKLLAQAQSDRLLQASDLALAEKLAEAIESGKRERANLLAIMLAKRLGYSDYRKLLQEMGAR